MLIHNDTLQVWNVTNYYLQSDDTDGQRNE